MRKILTRKKPYLENYSYALLEYITSHPIKLFLVLFILLVPARSFALESGEPLKKKKFLEICWNYASATDKSQVLNAVASFNKDLAETLVIFSKPMRNAGSDMPKLKVIMNQMYMHYVINTNGPIPELDTDVLASDVDDHFDVFAAATEYARMLGVGVSRRSDGTSLLELNGKQIPCPSWGVLPGWSAAWSLRKVGPVINRVRYGRDDVIPSVVFGFDENATQHSLANAMTLADFAHLAYMEPDFIKNQLQLWGYDTFHWIEDEETDTQSFVASTNSHSIVCFRGTGSGTDWVTDIKLFKTAATGGTGNVHTGFKGALDSVWPKISNKLSGVGPNQKIFFTGHSLGAALAQLAAYRQSLSAPSSIAGVYVYGSPRVGDRTFRDAYNAALKNKTFLHINNSDIVTQVPPRILGYRHLGNEPRKFDRGHVIASQAIEIESGMPDKEFHELDLSTQREIEKKMRQANISILASTKFLDTRPEDFQSVTYSAIFETGRVDDHGMDQYLFKFACAIVDGELKKIGQ